MCSARKCGTCRFWMQDLWAWHTMGICDAVVSRESDEPTPEERAVVVGGYEIEAHLRTHEDFGCTLHEEKTDAHSS